MSEVFHAGEVQIPNPLQAIGQHKIQLAKQTAMIGGIGLVTSFAGFALVSAKVTSQDTIGAIVLSMLGAFAALSIALAMFLQGRRESRPVVLPPTVPGDYWGLELMESLHNRVLRAYQLPAGLLRRLQRKWGSNSLFAPQENQAVATSSLDFVLYGIITICGLALIGLPAAAAGSGPFTIAIGVLAVAGVAFLVGQHLVFRWRLVRRLVGESTPQCLPEERLDTVHGGGDPFILYADLEQRLLEMRNNRVPNRTLHRKGWDGTAAHITETGRFTGELLIENQPLSGNRATPPIATELLGLSTIPIHVGTVLVSFSIPGANIVTTLILAAAGALALLVGRRAISDATTLSKKFRWESTALLLVAEGTTGKSEIRAGRSRDDSFESTNTVIRSDGKFRWYAGKIISENVSLDSPRLVMAIVQDPDSHKMLEITAAALEAFRNKGVRIQQIDFQDSSIENVLRANVLATKAKGTNQMEVAAPASKAKLRSGKPATAARGFCTECGHPKQVESAKFCGMCGVQFSPAASTKSPPSQN
ncbi:MAG: zinc ribbon domain-containing protein [Thermoplasmatota archaeon]